jgi:hypothetical protein
MSALAHLDVLATHATRYSGDSGSELSTALLIASAVGLGAAGIGLIVLCVRALVRRSSPSFEQPWIAQALANPTLHTQRYEEQQAAAKSFDAQPLSTPEPAPVTLPRQPMAAVVTMPMASPPPSAPGPSSTDPTVEMDLRAFASYQAAEEELQPVPPAATSTAAIPLTGRRERAVQTFEIPPPPPDRVTAQRDEQPSQVVRRSGTMEKADSGYVRTMASFNDGARRA